MLVSFTFVANFKIMTENDQQLLKPPKLVAMKTSSCLHANLIGSLIKTLMFSQCCLSLLITSHMLGSPAVNVWYVIYKSAAQRYLHAQQSGDLASWGWVSLMLPSGSKVIFGWMDPLHRFLIKWIVLLIRSGTQHSQWYTSFSEQMFVLQMEEDSCAVAGQ